MHVLVAIIHHNVFGGPHNQLLRLREPLLAQGWETIVVLPREPGNAADRLRTAGIKVLQVPLHRPRKCFRPGPHLRLLAGFRSEVAELRRIIRSERADVVQVFGPMYPHGAVAARQEGVPVVWQLLGTFAPGPIRTVMMPVVLHLSDVVMTTGMGIARAHPGAMRLGNRLMTFFPPVDSNEFRPDPVRRKLAREKLGISPDDLLVGTVGNFNRVKGHDLLVRSAHRVRQCFPRVRFRILGAATPSQAVYYRAKVKNLAADLGLLDNDYLRFVVPGSRVAHYLPAFDMFVLSSRAEGIPTSILEAMACGLPVVATDVGSIKEVVGEGITGRVVRPQAPQEMADAIVDLLRNPVLRSTMGAAARRKAFELYSTTVCAETHLHAYEMAQEVRRLEAVKVLGGRSWRIYQDERESVDLRRAQDSRTELGSSQGQ